MGDTSATGPAARSDRGARPLRIALVTSSYNYIEDGVALTLNRLVGFLESQGVRVLVFTPVARRPAFAHQGQIVPVPSAPFPLRPEYRLSLGLTRSPRARLRRFDPDLIHIATPDFLGRQALALGRRLGTPVVASYHTRYETYLKYYGLGALEKPFGRWLGGFYAACREVYAPSPSMVEQLSAQGGGGAVRLWGRGVDTARFAPAHRSAGWRQALGIGPRDVAVTFVSRLVREKRLETLAAVLSRLGEMGPHVRGVVVGEGPEQAALRAALPDCRFPGFLTGADLAAAYASSDIFLFPSDTETFGAVTLEAMASGLPTVCADATGSRSLVVPGVTGYLAPAQDGQAFFDRVRGLALDDDLRWRMGAAARLRSLAFSWDEVMAGLLARYRAVVGTPRP